MTLVPPSVVSSGAKDGVTVAGVDHNGIAAQKGLNVGDVILQANGKTVSRPANITAAFAATKTDGKPVLLRVKSGDTVRYLALAAKTSVNANTTRAAQINYSNRRATRRP